ncbi:MAG TPA: DUF6629 family protein [Acidimicrobiales bacterium]|jgi:hypothetical protein
MCFSPQADLSAALVVGAIGLDAVRRARNPAERLLASVPLVLAGHQFVEAFVWWGLEGDLPRAVWRSAVYLYVMIAFGVVPVLVPLAVQLLEPPSHRVQARIMTAIGSGVAVVLVRAMLRGPVEATIEGHHVAYWVDLSTWAGVIIVLYVVATCGSLLLSSHAAIRWFGIGNLVAVILLGWLAETAFVSLWCALAAVTSVAVEAYLRHGVAPPSEGAVGVDHR